MTSSPCRPLSYRCRAPRKARAGAYVTKPVLTTFSSYGTIPPSRQAEIMRRLAVDDAPSDVSLQAEMLRKVADQMQRRGSYWRLQPEH
jgi:hypothetical protein